MPPIRRSDRVPKPKIYWEPTITSPRKRQPPFTIYSEPLEPPSTQPSSTQPLQQGLEEPQQPYQPYFLPTNRAGKPQNMPKDISPIKLFQLFFTVKEIENIVQQTNKWAASISFRQPWRPLTTIEAYRYLGCLIYMGIQPFRDLHNYWQLDTPIA
jgi:hypothetical protein